MKRAMFWATVAAGAIAAYLMYRRGEPVGTVARKAILHPVASFVSELS